VHKVNKIRYKKA